LSSGKAGKKKEVQTIEKAVLSKKKGTTEGRRAPIFLFEKKGKVPLFSFAIKKWEEIHSREKESPLPTPLPCAKKREQGAYHD